MTTITINESSLSAKKMLEFLKTQPHVTFIKDKVQST